MSARGDSQGEPERIAFSFHLSPALGQSPSTGGLCFPSVPLCVGTRAMQNGWGTIELRRIAIQPWAAFAYPLWTAGLPLLLSTGWYCARNLVLSFTQSFKTILRIRTIQQEFCKAKRGLVSWSASLFLTGSYCLSYLPKLPFARTSCKLQSAPDGFFLEIFLLIVEVQHLLPVGVE